MNKITCKKNTCILVLYVCLLNAVAVFAQNPNIDSLKKKLATNKEDTGRVNTLNELGSACYAERNYELSGHYGQLALTLAKKLNYPKGQAAAYGLVGRHYLKNNRYSEALQSFQPALEMNKKLGEHNEIAQSCIDIAGVQYNMGNYGEAVKY